MRQEGAIGRLWRALTGRREEHGRGEIPWRAGVDPGEIVIRPRDGIRLVFNRQDVTEATETVCFPDFGIVATLPPFVATTVDVGPQPPGRYVFCSADGDIHGCLVVRA